MRGMDLRAHALEAEYGLITENQRLLNQMLHDYDPYLSFRRIPENDPAFREGMTFDPPRVFGVHEETSAAGTKWVFTVPEVATENPTAILGRVVAGDSSKLTPAQKIELLKAAHAATEAAKRKRWEEKMAERRDEMLFIASSAKSTIRHKIDGEDVVLSASGIRQLRHHV